jgi:hypothetical protein
MPFVKIQKKEFNFGRTYGSEKRSFSYASIPPPFIFLGLSGSNKVHFGRNYGFREAELLLCLHTPSLYFFGIKRKQQGFILTLPLVWD